MCSPSLNVSTSSGKERIRARQCQGSLAHHLLVVCWGDTLPWTRYCECDGTSLWQETTSTNESEEQTNEKHAMTIAILLPERRAHIRLGLVSEQRQAARPQARRPAPLRGRWELRRGWSQGQ